MTKKKVTIKKVTPTIEEPDIMPATVITETEVAKPKTKSLKEVYGMFPTATSTITQREYGEEFLPKYQEALGELKKIAK